MCLYLTSTCSASEISKDPWETKLNKIFLAPASPSYNSEKSQRQHRFHLVTFIINREHSTAEFANRAYHNRQLPGPAKEQDSRRPHFPQWQTWTLFTSLYISVPQKYTAGSCFSADLLGSKTIPLLNTDIPFLISMQKYATHNSILKCYPGTALLGWRKTFAMLKVYNQSLLPRGICETGMFGTSPTE